MASVRVTFVLLLGLCWDVALVSCEEEQNVTTTQPSVVLNEPDFPTRKFHEDFPTGLSVVYIETSLSIPDRVVRNRNAGSAFIAMRCECLLVTSVIAVVVSH